MSLLVDALVSFSCALVFLSEAAFAPFSRRAALLAFAFFTAASLMSALNARFACAAFFANFSWVWARLAFSAKAESACCLLYLALALFLLAFSFAKRRLMGFWSLRFAFLLFFSEARSAAFTARYFALLLLNFAAKYF